MRYNWQQVDWPNFKYKLDGLASKMTLYTERVGQIKGILSALPEQTEMQAIIDRMVAEAIKTSEIEGEYISRKDVMSSIKNNLGLNPVHELVKDKRAKGIGQLMVNIRQTFQQELSEETLHHWHSLLMEGSPRINKGTWRVDTFPMQVVSGRVGKEKVHFEAPPSNRVPKEMIQFIRWFNESHPQGTQPIANSAIRSAIAHLYFETIHPYEDGNGRIGRAISEKALYQGAGMPMLISLSETIEAAKQDYYQALMLAQSKNEISAWIAYFLDTILAAQDRTVKIIGFILQKTQFFDRFKAQLNDRQEKVISRMLRDGQDDFKNGMSAKKYMSIAKTSKATATRDLQALVKMGAFVPFGAGRNSRYRVNL